MKTVKIVEVGPRDGLQNERRIQTLLTKKKFIRDLSQTGLRHIEIGAFVSPKWVPQMAETLALTKSVVRAQASGRLPKFIEYGTLVPNERGMEDALKSGIKSIAVFGACSETFSKRNINCSIDESLRRFEKVLNLAHKHRLRTRGYLSTVFGCPYEGWIKPSASARLSARLRDLGVEEISLGDTVGVATPNQVRSVLQLVLKKVNSNCLAMHFHDTRGTALANVCESLKFGIRTFDSSLGGLGGCPYAEGAAGNLATEDLVYLLHGLGFKTGVKLQKLIRIRKWLEEKLDHDLPSKVSRAGHYPR